ncbi:MAG: Calx-beta domain-containing protein [Candidatus Marithrix sp.]
MTWDDGDNQPKSIDLELINDDEIEEDEIIELYLFNPTGEITLGVPNQATLIIADDDSITSNINFAMDSYTVNESNSEPVVLTVNRNGNSEGEVSVQYFGILMEQPLLLIMIIVEMSLEF